MPLSWSDITAETQVDRTGLAVLKLESRAFETGKDPFDPGYEYSQNVAVPLIVLYEMSIWLAKLVERREAHVVTPVPPSVSPR